MFTRGDHVRVWRVVPGFWHHGIYEGDGLLIHYSGEVGRKINAAICRVGLAEFLSGAEGEVVPCEVAATPDEVIERAQSRMGEAKYHLVFNNCEHFAEWCKTGKAKSDQVLRAPIGLVAARAVGVVCADVAATAAVVVVGAPLAATVAAPVAGFLGGRAAWKWISKRG